MRDRERGGETEMLVEIGEGEVLGFCLECIWFFEITSSNFIWCVYIIKNFNFIID